MSERPTNTPEQKTVAKDNARKFIIGEFDPSEVTDGDVTSFKLIVDWLETGEDDETKLARKIFSDGREQILLIQKVAKDGNRVAEKVEISQEEYDKRRVDSQLHLEKTRYEFGYTQNGVEFSLKYDDFGDERYLLEVDAADEAQRVLFNPHEFPGKLREVEDDSRAFEGYRIVEQLAQWPEVQ